jgi:hypothetical protein
MGLVLVTSFYGARYFIGKFVTGVPIEARYSVVVDGRYSYQSSYGFASRQIPIVVKGRFFPRVVNPMYRICRTMCNARI